MDHFEKQWNQLKSKQQSLFQLLSNGFQGDLKKTIAHVIAHVIAITQTCKDLERLQVKITEISTNAKAKQWAWLMSCNEDGHNVLNEAQEQLADANPLNTTEIQTEQAWIRLSKENWLALQEP